MTGSGGRLIACGGVAATVCLMLTGCSGTTPAAAPTAVTATATATPGPHVSAPEEICASVVTYWADRLLVDDSMDGDYQEMGLSGGELAILQDVLAAARAERRRHGLAAARRSAGAEVERRCTAWTRNRPSRAPSANGWPG